MNIDVALQTNINGSTAKTTSTYASTDLVQLYDNSGNPNGKITKSVLMECVKASLPSLLTDQTTVSDVLGLNSGNLSKITASNLASVLGGLIGVNKYVSNNASFTIGSYSAFVVAKVKRSMKGICFCVNGYGVQKLQEADAITISWDSNTKTVTVTDAGSQGFDYIYVLGNVTSFS